MIHKISLLLILLFSLSAKVDSLIIKNHLLTINETIHHLEDLEHDEIMFIEFCQFGCTHHRVSRMSITKKSEHFNLILYNTPNDEHGGIWTSSYHDSTTYHNSFTFSKMQLADFQEALLPNTSSNSTNHNLLRIIYQGQEYWSGDRASKSKLETFLIGLEAEQCTCENSKYFRSEEYKNYLLWEMYEFRNENQPISPFIDDQFD